MAKTTRQTAARLTLETRGAVLLVGLNRPEKRNAVDEPTIAALHDVFSAPPNGVRAIVVFGHGPHFCAGLDLSDLRTRGMIEGVQHSRAWHRCFEHIEFGAVPVVAALQGAVVGGGLELAAAAHIRVAERSAFYALPEGQRGIFVGGGGSVRLPRLIGVARMADMMLTGRTYAAEEGLTVGFSQYVEGEGEALPKAIALAEKIAGNAPMTNFAVVQALPRIAESDPRIGFFMESLTSAMAQSDPEAKKRMQDFLEKRAAKVAAPKERAK